MLEFVKNFFGIGGNNKKSSSFDAITAEQLEAHMAISRYGDFVLTDAIRPAYNLAVTPREGYRHETYRDEDTGVNIPVIMASATREKLLTLFLDLLEPLGAEVDVVLEASHDLTTRGYDWQYREEIDLSVLQSTIIDHAEVLENDGNVGIAVLNPDIPVEVQFDEHKLLVIYGQELGEFERILEKYRIRCDEGLRLITDAEHMHHSSEYLYEQFLRLQIDLGLDGDDDSDDSFSEQHV